MIHRPKKSLGLKNNYVFARAKKALGQNFLKSAEALRKIVEAGEIKPDDVILEIGPGKGALTKQLLASRGKILAIEKDRGLFEFLKIKFAKEITGEKLILAEDDILKFSISNFQFSNYKVIANIPYNITGAILKKFLTAERQPERMVLMVQKEVGERIMAMDKKESLLSISVKAYGEPKLIMKVEKRYFSPPPEVDSVIIAINNISRRFFASPSPLQARLPDGQGEGRGEVYQEGNFEDRFWQIVKAGFAHKRKKLSGNLKNLLKKVPEEYKNKRAEDLSLEDWLLLAKIWAECDTIRL